MRESGLVENKNKNCKTWVFICYLFQMLHFPVTALAIPFFFFVSCRMRFLILGRSVGKEKKKTKIKLKRSLELDGLVPQHNIREAWKQQGVVAKSTWRQW